jgi:transcriptional regulator with XRE-family HTH domain
VNLALSPNSPSSFGTFGDLLKYLRRRERLTQLELSIAVGYSEAQITRLEKNYRRPDLAALKHCSSLLCILKMSLN